MEGKASLLDNMIGVGDMVLLEPLSEDSFLENLKKRFDHNEIYVSLFYFSVRAVLQTAEGLGLKTFVRSCLNLNEGASASWFSAGSVGVSPDDYSSLG